ncbi:divergent polysaccharide deacetylase family protein [Thaumasiovibrio sp. DFM-14]|uniref:divergent polysaccharide deacetylase family protein n=1 Tax=Thaumasiovibrio sp. DFM-14 TaxID=3384792 RepID=UPI0039A0B128
MRFGVSLLCLTPCWLQAALLALVIDDMGYRPLPTEFDSLPPEISLSILPDTPYGQAVAQSAMSQQRDILIHMPMQPAGAAPLEPATLLESMSQERLQSILRSAITQYPDAIGLNNHMGSYLTAQPEPMHWVMQVLALYNLHFLDSMTTIDSLAATTARHYQIPTLQRHIFIDHEVNPDFITRQLKVAEAAAQQHGFAIAIGHPHPLTLRILQQQLPLLDVELVSISTLWSSGKR